MNYNFFRIPLVNIIINILLIAWNVFWSGTFSLYIIPIHLICIGVWFTIVFYYKEDMFKPMGDKQQNPL